MSRALVTGADGFVGRHLVAYLNAEGDDVVTTDRAARGPDLADAAAIDQLIDSTAPEVVYHLAGWSDVGGSWEQPEATLRANVLGTDAVLRACSTHDVQRVLIVTSADVYGSVAAESQPIDETAELRPESPYAASKAAAELVAIQAGLGRGLHVVRARAFNHAGPGQRPDFVIPALTDRILSAVDRGDDTISVGALEPTRDFTDVRDVVRAYRSLVSAGRAGEAYNVCSGTEVAIGDIFTRLAQQCGESVTPHTDAALVRPVEVARRVGDPSKLHNATGWTPAIPLDSTLADVVADRRAARANTIPHGD